MKKYHIIPVLLVMMAPLWSCQNKIATDLVNETFPSEQENIKVLLNDIFNVAKAKNMDSLDSYHLNSPKFSRFDDGEFPGRQDYAAGKKSENDFFTSVEQFNFTLPDIKVDVFGDVAIASFIIDYSVLLSGNTIAGKSRGTLVFVKDSNRWKIVHEHFSPMIQTGGQ